MGKNLLGFHQGFVGVHVSNCVLIMPRALSAVLLGPEQHHAANWPEATSMNPFLGHIHALIPSAIHFPNTGLLWAKFCARYRGCDNANKTKQIDMVLTLLKLTVQMGREKINNHHNLVG